MSEVEAGPDVPETDANVAPVDETVEESTPQEPEPQEEPDRVQKRINQLTWEKHEANRRAKELEERLAALEAQNQPQPRDVVSDIKPPNFSDYSSDEEYAAAMQEYTVQTVERLQEQSQSEIQRQQQEAEKRQKRDAYQTRIAQYAVENDGFVEAIQASNVNISEAVEQVLFESERAAELTHWLAENAAEAVRINNLPPVLAAKELGRIEATFDAVQPKKASNAPQPQTELSGGEPAPTALSDDMDIDEWMRRRNEQVREKQLY